jgi:hypothetical protein
VQHDIRQLTVAEEGELKKEEVTVINENLVVYLNAMQQVNAEMYGEFANTIKVIIAENNETVKRRTKKKPGPDA